LSHCDNIRAERAETGAVADRLSARIWKLQRPFSVC
jgi:hypothetical protein